MSNTKKAKMTRIIITTIFIFPKLSFLTNIIIIIMKSNPTKYHFVFIQKFHNLDNLSIDLSSVVIYYNGIKYISKLSYVSYKNNK